MDNRKTYIYVKTKNYKNLEDIETNLSFDGLLYLTIVDVIEDFDELLNINDNIYSPCSARLDGYGGYSSIIVEKVTLTDKENIDETYEDNITCPVCGYVDNDSWECSDEDDEYECGSCRAILSYDRVVSVEYVTTVKEMPRINDII